MALSSLRRTAIISRAIALLGIGVLSAPTRAQTVSGPLSEDTLFQTMLSSPSNLDTTLSYAVSAEKGGDVDLNWLFGAVPLLQPQAVPCAV
jgi:hypothetical protein